MGWHVLSNYLGMTCTILLHSPISAEIKIVDSQSNVRILLWLRLTHAGDFAEKRVLKLVERFSGHCCAIKS